MRTFDTSTWRWTIYLIILLVLALVIFPFGIYLIIAFPVFPDAPLSNLLLLIFFCLVAIWTVGFNLWFLLSEPRKIIVHDDNVIEFFSRRGNYSISVQDLLWAYANAGIWVKHTSGYLRFSIADQSIWDFLLEIQKRNPKFEYKGWYLKRMMNSFSISR